VLGITMPPWPGADEAIVVAGPWPPTAIPSGR
jgi:mannose-6-phosphate isomerase-like protein (cupin superfamily)